jgi:hypothetical protein
MKQNKKYYQVKKLIAEMQEEINGINKALKKHKTESSECAFLLGERKQVEYYMDALKKIIDPKLLDE